MLKHTHKQATLDQSILQQHAHLQDASLHVASLAVTHAHLHDSLQLSHDLHSAAMHNHSAALATLASTLDAVSRRVANLSLELSSFTSPFFGSSSILRTL